MKEEIKVGDLVRGVHTGPVRAAVSGWITYRVLVIKSGKGHRLGIIKCCPTDIDIIPYPLKVYLRDLEHIPNKKSKRKYW